MTQAKAAGRAAQAAVGAGINSLQKAIIEQINRVRTAMNNQVLAIIAGADHAADVALENFSQKDVQALLNQMMRLAKMLYGSQLVISWAHASAHPLLLKEGTKAFTGSVLGTTQPREPWQDVHVQIEGPAVDDVAMNFIGRWNACQNSYLSDKTVSDMLPNTENKELYVQLIGPAARKSMFITGDLVPPHRPTSPSAKPTGVAVRVLRSAPRKLCLQEAQARGEKVPLVGSQHEIQNQMVTLIDAATDFIYIENQFFQTRFGEPSIKVFTKSADEMMSGPMKYMMGMRGNRLKAIVSSAGFAPGKALMPDNPIGEALGNRITQAVRRGQPFHVYLVLPVHPEGRLDDITVVGQVHWTMQSLVFADHSLVNRVRRAIAAKRLCKNPLNDAAWETALVEAGKMVDKKARYEDVKETDWSKYLTLLNLRNCQKVNGRVVTEQIYIHSKLLIVDDRHVLLGSANINDRSQSGKRDSEIAVTLLDRAQEKACLRDSVTFVNPLARKLRIEIWKKHFGITCKGNDIVKPANKMLSMIEKPAAMATIQAIQELAENNSKIYSNHFSYVPWSNAELGTGASIWPVCAQGIDGREAGMLAEKMPFHENFWSCTVSIKQPAGIKGFFTKLPTNWTIGENNHPGQMNVMALTKNDLPLENFDSLDAKNRTAIG